MSILDSLTKSAILILIFISGVVRYLLKQRDLKTGERLSTVAELSLRNKYLAVYGLAVLGDWLQGPYVYRLYVLHGLSESQIHQLFIVGFSSACVIGPVCGAFWDRFGRKIGILTYGVLYGISCLITAHGGSFFYLIFGRVFGGIATAILFSVFESWLVSAGQKASLTSRGLDLIFTQQTMTNSLIAVFSGFLAQFIADVFGVEYVFDFAALILFTVSILAAIILEENYGNQEDSITDNFLAATKMILSNWRICSLGVIQALFEGSMYAFVLMWTPALSGEGDDIPHGLIFSSLMLAMLAGSLLNDFFKPRLEVILGLASFALSSVSILHFLSFRFSAFLVFEACVGSFWPLMASLRSRYITDGSRCAVLSIFRVPLNLIVIWLLGSSIGIEGVFALCGCFLLSSVVIHISASPRYNPEEKDAVAN